MQWKFYHVPDGLKDWPDQKNGTEYIQYYVEREPGVRVGYYGYGKQTHVFEYARGELGFKFDVVATSIVKSNEGDYRKTGRHLGPKCKVWIDNIDVARMLSTGAAKHFVSDITEVLLSGVLLNRTCHVDLLGPPIERVAFESLELERLNSNSGIAK
jgi:hypothetical protein